MSKKFIHSNDFLWKEIDKFRERLDKVKEQVKTKKIKSGYGEWDKWDEALFDGAERMLQDILIAIDDVNQDKYHPDKMGKGFWR